jgi:hypothetical protein
MLSNKKPGAEEVASIPRSPIVLGISGHLNIRTGDIPALKGALQTLFNGLEKSYPNTPLMLMSSLAGGADQLAAEVALEWMPRRKRVFGRFRLSRRCLSRLTFIKGARPLPITQRMPRNFRIS